MMCFRVPNASLQDQIIMNYEYARFFNISKTHFENLKNHPKKTHLCKLTFKPLKKVTKKGHLPTLCREPNEAYANIYVGTLWRGLFGTKIFGLEGT